MTCLAYDEPAHIEDGVYQELYPSGKLRRRLSYQHHQLNGPFQSFDEEGHKIGEGYYENDLLIDKAMVFSRSGTRRAEIHYKKGVLHGNVKTYYPAGEIKTKALFL